MARLIMAGQEVGSASWSGTTPTAVKYSIDGGSVDNTVVKTQDAANARPGGGEYALQIPRASSSDLGRVAFDTLAAWSFARDYFASFAFKFDVLPTAATTKIFGWSNNGGSNQVVLAGITSAGKIYLADGLNAQIGSVSTMTIQTGRWYVLQSKMQFNSGASDDRAELKIYDTVTTTSETIASTTTASFSTNIPAAFVVGIISNPGVNLNMWIDDVIMNDDQGASNNTYPDPTEVIVPLRPVSDNARGNWTAGAGGTTNLYQALDNVPPVGLSSASATDTSQIKDVTSSATSDADFNCKSYTAAGISAADTITSVMAAANASQATATTISVGVSIVSNPSNTEGTDSNNLVASLWGLGWTGSWPTTIPVNAPTVTLGTQPVLRIGKRTATTTGLHVDAAAIIVGVVPSPSTDTTFAQDARITGQLTSNTVRDVRIQGTATTTVVRDVRITGQLSSSTVQDARVSGSALISVAYDSRITGTATSNTAFNVRLTGAASLAFAQDVRITSQASSNTLRDVRVTGQVTASLATDARVFGTTTIPVSFEARITGIPPNNIIIYQAHMEVPALNPIPTTRDVRIIGITTSARAQDVRITGVATTSDVRDVRITGQLTTSLSTDVRTVGTATISSVQNVRVTGQLTTSDVRDVRITGQLTSSQAADARITGQLTSSRAQDARLTGTASLAAAYDVRIYGGIVGGTNYQIDARVTGANTSSRVQEGRIVGQATSIFHLCTAYDLSLYDVGLYDFCVDNLDVRITGQLTTSTVQDVRITGTATSSRTNDVRVTGKLTTSSAQDVRVVGQATSFFRGTITNLFPNGGYETNIVGTSGGATTTLTRDLTKAYDGIASLRAMPITPGSYADVSGSIALSGATAGRTYTISLAVYIDALPGVNNISVYLREFGGAQVQSQSSTGVTLVTGWNVFSHTRTIVENDRTLLYWIVPAPNIGSLGYQGPYYIDAVQIAQYPIATPYIETNGAPASVTYNGQPVRVTGEAAANLAQDVRVTGQLTTSSAYDVRLTGQATTSDVREARIFGHIITSQALDARIIGKTPGIDTIASWDARVSGKINVATSYDVRTTGTATSSRAQDARVTAQLTTSYLQDVRLVGQATLSRATDARIVAQLTSNAAYNVRITAQAQAIALRDVRITGTLTSSVAYSVKLTAEGYAAMAVGASIFGVRKQRHRRMHSTGGLRGIRGTQGLRSQLPASGVDQKHGDTEVDGGLHGGIVKIRDDTETA